MSHYYSKKEGSFPKKSFGFTFQQNTYQWIGSDGVFAGKSLDQGTDLLLSVLLKDLPFLNTISGDEHIEFLDLGCGTGITGLIFAESVQTSKVTLSDINTWAVQCACANRKSMNRDNATCVVQDKTGAFSDRSFHVVALNPPIRTGNENILDMFSDCSRILKKPSGCLYIVVRAKQGGKRLASLAGEWYLKCELMARKKGYLVYRLWAPV